MSAAPKREWTAADRALVRRIAQFIGEIINSATSTDKLLIDVDAAFPGRAVQGVRRRLFSVPDRAAGGTRRKCNERAPRDLPPGARRAAVHGYALGVDLITAVDRLQDFAFTRDLVDEIGQDAVQAIMAEAFGPLRDEQQLGDEYEGLSSTFARTCKLADAEYARTKRIASPPACRPRRKHHRGHRISGPAQRSRPPARLADREDPARARPHPGAFPGQEREEGHLICPSSHS